MINTAKKPITVVLFGEKSVGKTSLIQRYVNNIVFNPNTEYGPTNLCFKNFKIDEHTLLLQFWDTCGQERFGDLPRIYYKMVNIAVLMFDLSNLDSFQQLQLWVQRLQQCERTKVRILLGNKSDLERQVSIEDIKNFAKTNGFIYAETNVKTMENVDCIFELAARVCFVGREW